MNRKFTWHPELLSSQDLAEFLQEFSTLAEETTLEEFRLVFKLIAPILPKTQHASLLKQWGMARVRSGKLTQEEAEQFFEWIAPKVPKEWICDELRKRGVL